MRSLYLFYGEEKLLLERKLAALKKAFPASACETYSDDTPQERIIEALTMTSLFAADRLVILQEIDVSEADWLIKCCQELAPGLTLAVASSKIDRRSKTYKFLQQKAEVFEARSLQDRNELAGWLEQEAQKLGKKLMSRTALRLLDLSGTDMGKLVSELEKLSAYCGDEKEIKPEYVDLLAVAGELGAWDLINSLGQRNAGLSLMLLEETFGNRVPAELVIGQIAWQLRQMLQGNAAAKFSPEHLKHCLQETLKTDLAAKSGINPRVALPLLIYNICNG